MDERHRNARFECCLGAWGEFVVKTPIGKHIVIDFAYETPTPTPSSPPPMKEQRTFNQGANADKSSDVLDEAKLRFITETTIGHYDRAAEDYRAGTLAHDVSQNYEALLDGIEGEAPYAILDLGCGPGRDLRYFSLLGHDVTGLDGSMEFVSMARLYSGCEVLHQDFLALKLQADSFDAVFANASLFHVPRQELPRVLGDGWQKAEGRSFKSQLGLQPQRFQPGAGDVAYLEDEDSGRCAAP